MQYKENSDSNFERIKNAQLVTNIYFDSYEECFIFKTQEGLFKLTVAGGWSGSLPYLTTTRVYEV